MCSRGVCVCLRVCVRACVGGVRSRRDVCGMYSRCECVCVCVFVSVCAECGGLCACEACGVETCAHKAHIDGMSCVCVNVCGWMCVCVCVCMCVCVCVCAHVYVSVDMCVPVCVCVNVCV